ncbi:MAG: two-component system, OmpR family, phosphate regulon response regulator PhoB [Parcubacteria bacterium C7867-008]|nr:MAG: two-component system, OmpR family, phosphate regulon response regulator PhoB [Parcubacteria bacterium C7867-008]
MKKILIAEDDTLLRTVLANQFALSGFEVITAQDGEEGVEKYFSEKPDAVVLDVMMPKKSGLEMMEEIRTMAPLAATPFVVLSNSNELEHVARAADSGVIAYLIKSDPQITAVVNLIKEHLSKPKPADS